MAPTLLGVAMKDEIETSMQTVTKTERTVYDYKIELDGTTFDAWDMLTTLEQICEIGSNTCITDQRMVEALKKFRVIASGGNPHWGYSATKGENFDLFVTMLQTAIETTVS